MFNFFAQDEATKMRWRMALGGRAWRGYFPLGGELTSGRPDWKEGLYLGTELPEDQATEVLKLVDRLEQDDDVQKVFHTLG